MFENGKKCEDIVFGLKRFFLLECGFTLPITCFFLFLFVFKTIFVSDFQQDVLAYNFFATSGGDLQHFLKNI